MTIRFLILVFFIPTISFGQVRLKEKFVNDALNHNNYLIFNDDSTFKYRLAYHLLHDISCGQYKVVNDTIFLVYKTDLRDTICNTENIDPSTHLDTNLFHMRPVKLFFKDDKLYKFEDGKVRMRDKIEIHFKPDKKLGFHRKYLFFGPWVKQLHDTYYMVVESKTKWIMNDKKASR